MNISHYHHSVWRAPATVEMDTQETTAHSASAHLPHNTFSHSNSHSNSHKTPHKTQKGIQKGIQKRILHTIQKRMQKGILDTILHTMQMVCCLIRRALDVECAYRVRMGWECVTAICCSVERLARGTLVQVGFLFFFSFFPLLLLLSSSSCVHV